MKRCRNSFSRTRKIIEGILLSGLFIIIGGFFAVNALADESGSKPDAFLKYINKDADYHYRNVLVLGVGADWERAKDLMDKYHFDLVIPISREGGIFEDSVRATIEKLGIPTGTLKDLEGKNIENIFAHSWGSSRTINAISTGNIKVKNLHAIGSPESALFSSLGGSIERGLISKVYFHINEGDNVAAFRHFPSGLQGKFSGRIEFHFYTTERNSPDTIHKIPPSTPVLNVPLGYDHYYHYNSPAAGHALEGYFRNMSFAINRDPEHTPFNKSTPPFYNVPSYWASGNSPQSLTEAQIMTEMVHNKNRALIVGNGREAEIMYNNMATKLGKANVKWIQIPLSDNQLQLEAKRFGADVILGVKGFKAPKMKPLRSEYKGKDEYYEDIGKKFPPPPPDKGGGAAGIPNDIGGVMLHGAAQVSGTGHNGSQIGRGTFSLIFQNGNAEIDIEKLRKFVTALWAVYFSKEGPGISIDPIAPGIDKHLVRYIGRVINSDLGRVMRVADYTMKKWSVGTEKPDIDGFKTVDELSAIHGIRYIGASRRFWFVPEDMRFKLVGDALLFDSGKMTLKTEYTFLNKEARAEPADEAFAQFFTEHYNEIAEQYPIYRELFEYAKLVSLCKYLKEKGIPMLWFLLANKDMVITEDSPGTVDALAKKSDYFEYIQIEGGVDLAFKQSANNYIIDQEAAQAINEAVELYGPTLLSGSSVLPSETIILETTDKDFTLTPSQTLTLSRSAATGDKYQTDLALRYGKEPWLELVRYYTPEYEGPTSFGKGWHLLIPYQVEPYGGKKIEFLNAMIPEKMVVKNLLTAREEILTFSKDRYSIAGYVPDDLETSNLIGLFLLSDASFRLADKLGNEFQFNQEGHLTEMILSDEYQVKFEYGYAEAKMKEFTSLPYRIEPVGDKYELLPNTDIKVLKNVKLIDFINGKDEIFVFNQNNRYGIVGYTPIDEGRSKYTYLALLTDGSSILADRYGNEISFDPAGRFNEIRAWVVKGLSQGNLQVEFDYEFKNGQHRIKKARVIEKDKPTTLYAVNYEYGQDGRLSKVITPFGGVVEIKYDKEKVMVTQR